MKNNSMKEITTVSSDPVISRGSTKKSKAKKAKRITTYAASNLKPAKTVGK